MKLLESGSRVKFWKISKYLGLLSVSDKRAGIGVFGPALDHQGNSIAGCKLLREISNELRLNLFYDPEWNRDDVDDAVLREMR